MITNMPGSICPIQKNQLNFRMKMPEKEIMQARIHHQVKGAVFIWGDFL
jgi:hypothetical protein